MSNKKLKYLGYSIGFQEVPDEISLIINISGCPHKCKGCHSSYLWEYKGNYISEDLDTIINEYSDLITCVCFMGGDQNIEELKNLLLEVKNKNLKTCVYSGLDSKVFFGTLLKYIDYLKIGRYIEKLGGLTSKNTNQIMYNIKNDTIVNLKENI